MEAKDREVADQETTEEEEIDLAPVYEILDKFKQFIDTSLTKQCSF